MSASTVLESILCNNDGQVVARQIKPEDIKDLSRAISHVKRLEALLADTRDDSKKYIAQFDRLQRSM